MSLKLKIHKEHSLKKSLPLKFSIKKVLPKLKIDKNFLQNKIKIQIAILKYKILLIKQQSNKISKQILKNHKKSRIIIKEVITKVNKIIKVLDKINRILTSRIKKIIDIKIKVIRKVQEMMGITGITDDHD